MIIPNIWENKKCSKPPTSAVLYARSNQWDFLASHGRLPECTCPEKQSSSLFNARQKQRIQRVYLFADPPVAGCQAANEDCAPSGNYHV